MDETVVVELLNETLWGYSQREIARVKSEGRDFVHYTSAEAAHSIIEKNEIWLRNASVMNDYSEMAHGEACLRFCLHQNDDVSGRAKETFNRLHDGFYDRVLQGFNDSSVMRRMYTYLLSISEHGPPVVKPGVVDEESSYGRLSMWRAYGGGGGVALIFNQGALLDPKNVLPVYASPVFYGNPDAFAHEFVNVLVAIEKNLERLKQIDPNVLAANVDRFIHFACLACKHPGFREEREWRVTYSANPVNEHLSDEEFNASSKIKREFRTVAGIPQRIYKVPFVDYREETSESIQLPAILRRVVIGPTPYPLAILDSLGMAMKRRGFPDDKIRIEVSNIPIRT